MVRRFNFFLGSFARVLPTLSWLAQATALCTIAQMPAPARATPPHSNVPERLYCVFQTQVAPFLETSVIFQVRPASQSAASQLTASPQNSEPRVYDAIEVTGPTIDSLARARQVGWVLRDRSDGHRLTLRQAQRSARPVTSTNTSEHDQEIVDDWNATIRLDAVMVLPGDRPDHWSGVLESSHANWLSYRSPRGVLGSATQPGPLHFLRRRRDLIRHDESNVSAHCTRYPTRR